MNSLPGMEGTKERGERGCYHHPLSFFMVLTTTSTTSQRVYHSSPQTFSTGHISKGCPTRRLSNWRTSASMRYRVESLRVAKRANASSRRCRSAPTSILCPYCVFRASSNGSGNGLPFASSVGWSWPKSLRIFFGSYHLILSIANTGRSIHESCVPAMMQVIPCFHRMVQFKE